MQPLDGAYQRVKRAGVHLANLKRRSNILCQEKSGAVVIQRKPATFLLPDGRKIRGVLGSAAFPIGPTPQIFSILAGEVIYNLRAALDYLVYELAKVDSDYVVYRTQFPITFRNGMPIVDTLQQLKLDVTQTLDMFKPEFQR